MPSFLDIVKKIPSYAKFLKESCTKKKSFEEYEQVALCEEVSNIILKKLPRKLKDPGSFTIPCTIGDHTFDKALMDLGASVNIMPLSVYKKLGVGNIKQTAMTILLADKSSKHPRGIVEDVLVKVDKLIVPADFVVLEMVEGDPKNESPLIFGRPFMATAGTKINVKKGKLKMKVLGQTVEFQVFKPLLDPDDDLEECFYVGSTKDNQEKVMSSEEASLSHYDNENSCYELPIFEEFMKSYPPSCEAKEETTNASKNLVSNASDKKKRKIKRYTWPPCHTLKFLVPNSCIGGCGMMTTTMGAKEESFEPP